MTINDLYQVMMQEFGKVNHHLNTMDDRWDFRFGILNDRVDKLEYVMNEKFDIVYNHLDIVHGATDRLDVELAAHAAQLDRHELTLQ